MRILLPWEVTQAEARIFNEGLEGLDARIVNETDAGELLRKTDLGDVEIIVAGLCNRKIIENAPKLRYVQAMISAASHVDQKAAAEHGLLLATVKGANAHLLAEHAYFLMLSTAKMGTRYHQQLQEGVWAKHWGDELYGKRLGLIGFGNIAKNVARIAPCFGMEVSAVRKHKEFGSEGYDLRYLGGPADIGELVAQSDYVLVAVPKLPETVSLVNDEVLSRARPGTYLINMARGPIVSERAVADALDSSRLKGFATDVFPTEPNDFSNPLYHRPDVVATPHVAASSILSKELCMRKVVSNIHAYLDGKTVDNIVDYGLGY